MDPSSVAYYCHNFNIPLKWRIYHWVRRMRNIVLYPYISGWK